MRSQSLIGWFVGRKRSINDLPSEDQAKIRAAYEKTGFAHNESEEGDSFWIGPDAEGQARQRAAELTHHGFVGFYYSLPINLPLPEVTADFKEGTRFPGSVVEVIPLALRVVDENNPSDCLAVAHRAIKKDIARIRTSNQKLTSLITAPLVGDTEDKPKLW